MIKPRKPLIHRRINRSCKGKLVPAKSENNMTCLECKWIIGKEIIESRGYNYEAVRKAGSKYIGRV